MMKKVCVIGFGEMGKRHAKEFREATDGLIGTAAVVELNDQKYEEGCEWYNARPRRYASVAELMEKETPDGAIISTPNHTHLEVLKAFAGKSIPILLEKPLDTSLEKIEKVVRFAEDYAGPIMVDHVMRYAPIVRKAKALIEQGALGKVCSFNFVQTIGGGMFRNFRRTMAGGGGQLLEKATHDFDVLLFLTETAPKRVAAISKLQAYGGKAPNDLRCANCEKRVHCPDRKATPHAALKDVNVGDTLCPYASEVDIGDNESCLIELENGVFGTYSHCYFVSNYSSREYEIIGDRGIMRISFSVKDPRGDGRVVVSPRYGDQDADYLEFFFRYHGRIHYNGGPAVARHFYDLMSGAAKPFTTVNQAYLAELLSYGAIEAAKTDRFIDVKELKSRE